MRVAPRNAIKCFAVLICLWTVLVVLIAAPAVADDGSSGSGSSGSSGSGSDNSGSGSGSSGSGSSGSDSESSGSGSSGSGSGSSGGSEDQAAFVTTTTGALTPTPATTVPLNPSSATTVASSTTTTAAITMPPEIPTAPRFPDVLVEEPDTIDLPAGAASTQVDLEGRESLVLSFATSSSHGQHEGGTGGNGLHVAPREGLIVAFRTAVETVQSQLVLAIIVGILIAALTSIGLDKRPWQGERGTPLTS
jgi:hypothetical protein